jgi:deferrochelatase/peroxidase EfeB
VSQSLLTIIAPLAVDAVPDLQQTIDGFGNPAHADIAAALDRLDGEDGTHFMSLHAIRSRDHARAYVVLELTADGTARQALERIVTAIGPRLQTVFQAASDWVSGRDLTDYLLAHSVTPGVGWFAAPGALFAGTPGLSVGRIRAEGDLSARITALLSAPQPGMSALARLEAVRAALAEDPALRPHQAAPPYDPPSIPALVAQLLPSFAATFLWPVGILWLAWAAIAGWRGADTGFWAAAAWGLWHGAWLALLLVLVVGALAYVSLRRAEAADFIEERTANHATLAAMFERENRLAANHMISITQRKPGLLRRFTSSLVFWLIGQLVTRGYYQPGFLSDIGSIHFARWVTAPGSPDVLFFSNYDGSWESYLEDFITRAHDGLTGVWSNSIGFPRANNLFQDGATDAERFKRYARHSMQPTRFWYSAYPRLTTAEIRANAAIRRGLSGAMTEDEARVWLAQFGSAPRPASKLVSSEIQSLMFGGLCFMPHGVCLLATLPTDRAAARAWLRSVAKHVAFDDGRRLGAPAVVTLALGAPGLARLGLPAEALQSFPFAFLDGMTNAARARMLGDSGPSAPDHWHWGQTQPDAALLVYGRSEESVAELRFLLDRFDREHGATRLAAIPLKPVTRDKTEAFGFVDGISQPLIRGTYKGLKQDESIHLVEPGEFILGYPDNRGNLPPGPTLPATLDPANLLPLAAAPDGFDRTMVETPRAVGANGSFLVIRQLAQDRSGFDAYCAAEAERLRDRLPPPYHITAEFIAAKLVGRWRDGSSLVRHPYESRTQEGRNREKQHAAAAHGTLEPDPGGHHRPDNGFRFGAEDPEALRCPLGAHIRRANPRDSLDPGSDDELGIVNRHRIIRVGRQYVPAEGAENGLLFMCLNGDIERQFEFVQQTWLGSPAFHGLACEQDPLTGDAAPEACGFTIPSRDGPIRLAPLPRFVTTLGGGYFFLPGRRLIDYLSAGP